MIQAVVVIRAIDDGEFHLSVYAVTRPSDLLIDLKLLM
jgi:hypothetical protein